jgi:DNA-binding IscR family transcriptional regulator
MTASERQTFEVNCQAHPVNVERCDPANPCSIRPVWYALQRRIDELLSGVTLADLLRDEAEVRNLPALKKVG